MSSSHSRDASHAGSWYASDSRELDSELESYLSKVPDQDIKGIASHKEESGVLFPVAGARAIIAPHAGYAYSGPAAAWAYKSLDWSKAKRVFLLGPSHHYYLSNCALSKCKSYSTPLGELPLDISTIAELRATGKFAEMTVEDDEAEHSLEMHLPYIYKMLSKAFPQGPSTFPPLTPILVGSTSPSTEASYGAILAPYLTDPGTLFVISSDFCHWGLRFRYTYYDPTIFTIPASGTASIPGLKNTAVSLKANSSTPKDPAIHESIASTDFASMYAIETKGHDGFTAELQRTGNTVCGRHPIGVMMAALELHFKDKDEIEKGKFRFVKYERSSLVKRVSDSSVSYASAYAVF